MSKYEKIKELCREKGVSVSKAEADCGFAKGSLSKIDKHKPSYEKLATLSNYFSTPVFNLFYDDSEDARTISDFLHRFNEEIDEEMLDTARQVWRHSKEDGTDIQTPIRFYDVAAGDGRYNDGYQSENFRGTPRDAEEFCYIEIHGDSMMPKIQDGDILKVHFQTETLPTDYTVLKINGEKETIKHVEIVENGVWVRATNKEVFQDTFYDIHDVINLPIKIIGKATEIVYREI